jgi:hypothetical protein
MKLLIFFILFNVLNYTGAAAFSPLDLEPLFYLNPNEGLTFNPSTNKVSAWEDLTGNGHNFTQTNASLQPVYNSTGLNGGPVLEFTTSILQSFTFNETYLSGSEFTLVLVDNHNTGNGMSFSFWDGSKAAYLDRTYYYYLSGLFNAAFVKGGGSYISIGSPANISPSIKLTEYYLNNIKSYQNKILSGTGTKTPDNQTVNLTRSYIGRSGYYRAFYFNGQIGPVIAFNKILSTTDQNKLQDFFNSIYSIY